MPTAPTVRSTAVALLLLASSCAAPKPAPIISERAPESPGPSLTIYSTADPATFDPQSAMQEQKYANNYGYGVSYSEAPGYGVVREIRRMTLKQGVNRVEVSDIAEGIDPTTVSFRSVTDPASASVLEQNMEFDLVSPEKMLKRFLGKEVVLTLAGENDAPAEFPCTLLATPSPMGGTSSSMVVRTPKGEIVIQEFSRVRAIRLTDAGGAIISKPTLNWSVEASKAGAHAVEIGYQTEGMTWRADYNLLLADDEKAGELTGWVSILNQSGMTYNDARLKLVAGKVNRLRPERQRNGGGGGGGGLFGGGAEQFVEKAFADYHLYTLSRPTSLPDNSTKQIELFSRKPAVTVDKGYMWTGPAPIRRDMFSPDTSDDFGDSEPGGIHIILRMKNSTEAGLGLPLPAGRVRVYKTDAADGSREFIGENVIDHTPVNEPFQVFIGTAFDLVGSRTRTSFEREGNTATEAFDLFIRNRKKEPARIVVRETLYRWVNWKIIEASDKWTPVDSQRIDFTVDLKPNEEKKISYKVKYSW